MTCPSPLQHYLSLEQDHSFGKRTPGNRPLKPLQALIFNIPYQSPHYLSPTHALMLQLSRPQLILYSLQFRLMSFWWDLVMVNHFSGTLILSSFHFRKLYLIAWNTSTRNCAPKRIVYNPIRTLFCVGALCMPGTPTWIYLKTGNGLAFGLHILTTHLNVCRTN